MSEDIDIDAAFKGLSAEETSALRDKIAQAVNGAIQSHREEKQSSQLAAVRSQYEREQAAIVERTRAGSDQRIRELAALKAKYRGRGLQL